MTLIQLIASQNNTTGLLLLCLKDKMKYFENKKWGGVWDLVFPPQPVGDLGAL